MSGINDAEITDVQDTHFERILRMFAHSCALRLFVLYGCHKPLRLLRGKKMNVTYLNTVLRKYLYVETTQQVGNL